MIADLSTVSVIAYFKPNVYAVIVALYGRMLCHPIYRDTVLHSKLEWLN